MTISDASGLSQPFSAARQIRPRLKGLRLFQLHQTQTGARALRGINETGCGVAFLLHRNARPPRAGKVPHLRAGATRRIPVILSLEEIARLLEAAPGPKYKAALSAAYGAGLRVFSHRRAEGVGHRFRADAAAHRAGQGAQDRFAMLSPLRAYWSYCAIGIRIARPTLWLFPGRDPLLPLTTRQFNRVVRNGSRPIGRGSKSG